MDYNVKKLVRLEGPKKKSVYYIEGGCDSSETKPTERIADGSVLTETDTGNVYMFNAKTSAWVMQFSLQG